MNDIRLLIIDDDDVDRKAIRRALDKTAFKCDLSMADNAGDVAGILDEQPDIDCILLDYHLPGTDGLTLLSELQSKSSAPVIMLTGEGNEMVAVQALKRGAVDYIPKSMLAPDSLYRAIHQALEGARLRRQLADAQAQLERQALYDGITGLGNRSLFKRDLARCIADSRRNARPFGLLVMDLDKFKAANDTWGHAAGDAILAEVGHRLQHVGRANDLFYRLGGDEFTALIDAPDQSSALPLVNRVIAEITRPYIYQGNTIQIGVSIGVAFYPSGVESEAELIQAADRAMYQAKREGNSAVFDSDPGA